MSNRFADPSRQAGMGPTFSISTDNLPPLASQLSFFDLRECANSDFERFETLLHSVYQICQDNFPNPDECLDLREIKRLLLDPDAEWHLLLFHSGEKIVGAAHLSMHDCGNLKFGAVELIYLADEYKRHGKGMEILQSSHDFMEQKGAVFAIAEFHDPYLMTEDEMAEDTKSGINPFQRLRFWERSGYLTFDMPYLQPPMPGKQSVENLRLAFFVLKAEDFVQLVQLGDSGFCADFCAEIVSSYHRSFAGSCPDSELLDMRIRMHRSVPVIGSTMPRTHI